MKDFKDKIVVITGGASGIGFGFAKALGQEGAKIVLSDIRAERLSQSVAELQALGVEATSKVCDVTNVEDFEALADFAWAWKGRVDVAFNNAGIMNSAQAPIHEIDPNEVRRVMEVNYFSVLTGSSIFARRFVEQGTPAAIFNTGSENSLFHGVPSAHGYVCSKHAVRSLTEGMREELPDFIHVGLICPGFVFTELGPEENMQHGMPRDEFIERALKPLKAGEFYIISHSFNKVRIQERFDEVARVYDTYAPREEGDERFDVRNILKVIAAQQS